jgi:hypothetical protein
MRQSRPGSGRGFQAKVRDASKVVFFSLRSGWSIEGLTVRWNTKVSLGRVTICVPHKAESQLRPGKLTFDQRVVQGYLAHKKTPTSHDPSLTPGIGLR